MRMNRLVPVLVLLVTLLTSPPARAATFNVDRTDDDPTATTCDDTAPNDCSLRGAILAANARPVSEASIINVPAGTYVLTQASNCLFQTTQFGVSPVNTTSLCLAGNITLLGAGVAVTMIDGDRRDRVMLVGNNAPVEIRGLTIKNGSQQGGSFFGGGGGINASGRLTMSDSVVSNNTAIAGGGIYNSGALTVLRSTIHTNVSSDGGGIFNYQQSTLTVIDSAIRDNIANRTGGGIENFQGAVSLTGSEISGNTAVTALGGGIANFGGNFVGTLNLVNTTISGNRSDSSGGGIFNHTVTSVELNNVTIAGNASGTPGSGGGVANTDGGSITLRNTVIAGNTAAQFGPDCLGFAPRNSGLISRGHNLIQNAADCDMSGDTATNITGEDPRLGVLANNGGPTRTHALQIGSPAAEGGSPAPPGSGGNACAVSDQRGLLRPLGTTCDIGAFERSGTFSVRGSTPNSGGDTGSVLVVVAGDGFASGATVKLMRPGESDIVASLATVEAGGSAIVTSFDLAGKAQGPWDVVVTNPDGMSATLTGGFSIQSARAPQLWVQLNGRPFFRRFRLGEYTVFYGNRGNVDAVGVPLSISIPTGYALSVFAEIPPPPPQAGQVPTDWSQVPIAVFAGTSDGVTNVPLLLPVVPAGFSGILRIGLTASPTAQNATMLAAIGEAFFNPLLDPQIVADAVAGARAYAQQNLGVTIPPALVPDLERYATTQLESAVALGRQAVITSFGSPPQVYSQAQLSIDLARYGAARALASAPSPSKSHRASQWFRSILRSLAALLAQLGPTAAEASPCSGRVLAPGESCTAEPKPVPPADQKPPPGLTPAECRDLPGHQVSSDGSSCVPKPNSGCAILQNPFSSDPNCSRLPIRPVNSNDPNDKVGALGVAATQLLPSATPLSYTIFFENVSTATAPAQVVVITDQLDGQTMDLDSFSLGPIAFGNVTVSPLPGVSQFTSGVDLRPAQNVIVLIDAGLDRSTGLVTWLFTSIDPDTGQLTDDPLAGFLPPNVNPPEGDGSVFFTVQPKPGLATGTGVCNHASIVFDVNAAIITPQWCNTIDGTPPTSQVLALAATQSSPSFTVQWSGTDVGGGIADYTIFRSENGGPFTAFLTNTSSTSAVFPGVVGSSYAFYSVARDLVGNEEAPPATADTVTVVGGVDERQLTALSPAQVWVGLKNSDAVGLRLDLQVRVLLNGTAVGAGQVTNVAAGSSGFDNAVLHTIPLNLLGGPVAVPVDARLQAEVAVRRTCSGAGHRSGTLRLWYDGQPVDNVTRRGPRDAGTRFDATIDGATGNYFLRRGFALSLTAGTAKQFVDVGVDSTAVCPNRPFTSFGTWSVTLP